MDDSYWWSLYGMWAWMGPITKATVVLMALMLFCAIFNFLEQVEKNHAAGIATISALEVLRRCAPLNEVISSIETLDDKLSSPIVLAGLEAFKTAPTSVSDALATRLAERAMERREALVHLEARRGLILLDTVANLAPMLGMFATMLAIMGSFRATAESAGEGRAFLTNSLVHALVPVAIGLAVAIPTAMFFSYVSGGIEKLDARNRALMQQVREYLRTQPRATAIEELFPAEGAVTKTPHSGTRLVLGAVWLWWMYLVAFVVAASFSGS